MTFLGLSGSDAAYENTTAVIIPVPYEYSASFGAGTGAGPQAVLAASAQIELYDELFGSETWRPALHTAEAVQVAGPPEQLVEPLRHRVGRCLDDGKTPICLGGEHSISLGAIEAARERFTDLTVLSLDAHADLRDRYAGMALNHATVMRRASEGGPVVAVGIRSISQEEVLFAEGARDRVTLFLRHRTLPLADHLAAIVDALRGPVYLSIDVDVLDPSLLPATGTPEPGGLSWFELNDLLRAVTIQRSVVAADVVEFAPRTRDHTSSCIVARLLYRLVGFLKTAARAE